MIEINNISFEYTKNKPVFTDISAKFCNNKISAIEENEKNKDYKNLLKLDGEYNEDKLSQLIVDAVGYNS